MDDTLKHPENGTSSAAERCVKHILVVTQSLEPLGGAAAVGAWLLQALQQQYAVTVLTWGAPEISAINRMYGTTIDATRVCFVPAPVMHRGLRLLRLTSLSLERLFAALLARAARRELERRHYDLVISPWNELDVGQHVIQYIHFPWHKFPRPDVKATRYQSSPPARAYRALIRLISASDDDRIAANTTIVNSDWTGRKFESYYGTKPLTIYPPVGGDVADVPFTQRDDAFAVVGRITRDKRLAEIIAILRAVRQRGHLVRLHIVGQLESRSHARLIRSLVADNREWVDLHQNLPRAELVRLIATCRYGIHGMFEEHFGIAPAELQRAGCITFVPDRSGVAEIVRDQRLRYSSDADAIDKIDRVLADPVLRASVLEGVNSRRQLFSEQRFMSEMSTVIARALEKS